MTIVLDKDASSIPTWMWGQWYPISEEDVGFKTTIMPGENPAGKEQRNSEGTSRKVFSFPLKYISDADRAAIRDFYISQKGAFAVFFITVDSIQYTVRFRKDGFKFNRSRLLYSDTTIEVIEVL